MRVQTKLALGTALLALGVAPAVASADPSAGNPGVGHKPNPGKGSQPNPALPPQANAYGKYCQGESKEHVPGEKGTAFSRCVTAMAKLGNQQAGSPREACKGLSKNHVEGEKGTEFSRCVRAAAKLKKAQAPPGA